jgi:hypothetical protein
VVDELVGGVVRVIASLLHPIVQIIYEVLFRVVLEIVCEILRRIFSPIFRVLAFIGRVLLWPAECAYTALFAWSRRNVRQPVLAHAFALALLISGGFLTGAGASTLYHQVPGYKAAASLPERP